MQIVLPLDAKQRRSGDWPMLNSKSSVVVGGCFMISTEVVARGDRETGIMTWTGGSFKREGVSSVLSTPSVMT